MIGGRLLLAGLLAGLVAGAAGACTPGSLLPGRAAPIGPPQATLAPTLQLRQVDGGLVAFQSGRPVPDFHFRPRPRIDLDGSWRFQAAQLDATLSFSDRKQALPGLRKEAGDRPNASFDDSSWQPIAVPGTFDPPPAGRIDGGWYRLTFRVPARFPEYASLRFGSVNYLADVWLNGGYLGYHEGGHTPFSLDAGARLHRGATNTLLVRVSRPELGTRLDLVPWGLTDWWEYGGISGDVWLEGEPALQLVRADVVPHLDGADVGVVVANRAEQASDVRLQIDMLPAQVTAANLLDPNPKSLVAGDVLPLLEHSISLDSVDQGVVRRVHVPFEIRGPDLWSPAKPALYVLHLTLLRANEVSDEFYETFGLRQIQVDPTAPRLLLNGSPIVFHGVALHDEKVEPPRGDRPAGGPALGVHDVLEKLRQAGEVNADLVRADHSPPNPLLPMLADRVGFAVWEEVPLYHFTPESFDIAMQRGVAAQMLTEMALRDFNDPSVLFHGLSNESEGRDRRTAALTALRDLDRRIDGTRLVGQAAYGYDPEDPTQEPLDVAGFTFYHGVFYGGPLSGDEVRQALERAHARFPKKPIMILEFGRWADTPAELPLQQRVFDVNYHEFEQVLDTRPGGYLGAAVWWSLNDYWTERPGIVIEHFGLYRPDGSPRPVQAAVAEAYAASASAPAGGGRTRVVSGGQAIPVATRPRVRSLLAMLVYALALPAAMLAGLLLLTVRGARPGMSR